MGAWRGVERRGEAWRGVERRGEAWRLQPLILPSIVRFSPISREAMNALTSMNRLWLKLEHVDVAALLDLYKIRADTGRNKKEELEDDYEVTCIISWGRYRYPHGYPYFPYYY